VIRGNPEKRFGADFQKNRVRNSTQICREIQTGLRLILSGVSERIRQVFSGRVEAISKLKSKAPEGEVGIRKCPGEKSIFCGIRKIFGAKKPNIDTIL
jgi:hypothetical protein